MKQLLYTFLTFILLHPIQLFAQQLTEGVVIYTIEYPDVKGKEREHLDVMPDQLKIYFKGPKCRLELHTIAGPSITLCDNETGETYQLFELMGKKIAMRTNAKSIQTLDQQNAVKSNRKITPIKGTKKIAGYRCKGIQFVEEINGQNNLEEIYFSDQLPQLKYAGNETIFTEVTGMALEFNMFKNGLRMHLKAKEVKPGTYDDLIFKVPNDYEITTSEVNNH